MHTASPLARFFLERLRRCLLASVGLILFAFAYYLQLVASIGLSPWQALNEGLILHLPITFGQASILVSVLVVAADLLLREPIGLGTILDALLVGWATDLFLALDLFSTPGSIWMALFVLFLSLVIASVSQVIYMRAGLSCGPRDALMVALGKRVSRFPIGGVNIAMSLAVLLVGVLLGGSLGVGTAINLFGTGMIMEAVFRLLRFEPRSVTHEGLAQTARAFFDAYHAAKSGSASEKSDL